MNERHNKRYLLSTLWIYRFFKEKKNNNTYLKIKYINLFL